MGEIPPAKVIEIPSTDTAALHVSVQKPDETLDDLQMELDRITRKKRTMRKLVLPLGILSALILLLSLFIIITGVVTTFVAWPRTPDIDGAMLNFTKFKFVDYSFKTATTAMAKLQIEGSLNVRMSNQNVVNARVGAFTARVLYLGQDLMDVNFAESTIGAARLFKTARATLPGSISAIREQREVSLDVSLTEIAQITSDIAARTINVRISADNVRFTVLGVDIKTSVMCDVDVSLGTEQTIGDGVQLKTAQACTTTRK